MEKIPKYIPVRDYRIVKNKCEIDDNQINIILYYISSHKCIAIIHRLYYTIGNIEFKIYSTDETKYITLIIEDEKTEEIIIETEDIEFEPIIYKDQLIPKRIMQTFYKDEYSTEYHRKAIDTLIKLNPEYEYYYLNDYDCRQFIIDNYDKDVLYAYDKICIDAFRADLFRYCYLYKYGGCYFDHKVVLKMPIRNVIKPEDENVYCIDREGHILDKTGMFITVMCTIPGCVELYNAIHEIVANVKNEHIPWHWYDLTGPLLFYRHAHDKNIPLEHVCNMPKNQVVLRDTREVFFNTTYYAYIKDKFKHYSHPSYYYYVNYRKIDDNVIQVYPHSFPDTFEFKFVKLEHDELSKNVFLLIKRTDSYEGWDLDLKIKINENTYHAGSSKYVYFLLPL